ncbi:MAG: hypothetical protein IKT79_01795, partial [Akkermansia sp.]|nr:hypothetical protein [Akkermansia sp.]
GSLDRFSMVNGFIVSHDEAEAFYRNFMHVNADDPERRLALIGIEDPSAGGHCLVLLTTVYKTVTERDRSDVMRDLRNKQLPLQWTPATFSLSNPFRFIKMALLRTMCAAVGLSSS